MGNRCSQCASRGPPLGSGATSAARPRPPGAGGGDRLVRTPTTRTAATDSGLDKVGVKLDSIDERFRNIDEGLPPTAVEKTLIGLQMQLEQLDGRFDELGVRGLTGETPLRSRKRAMLARCEALQTDLGAKLRDVRSGAPLGGGGQLDGSFDAPVDGGGDRLVRIPTTRTAATDSGLDKVGVKLDSIDERFRNIDEGLPPTAVEKTLIGLQMQLEQLDGRFDELGVRGLTGETPLRSRKRAMLARCEALQTDLGAKLRDVRSGASGRRS
eukprot:COSAG01_NODE_10565_length_2131_cov_5.559055_1_plen_269_part_00